MATVRCTWPETSASWVTMTTVVPKFSFAARSAANTSSPLARSSSPVGSSANSTCGRLASATAMATRCCSPPESSPGLRRALSAIPSASSISAALRARSLRRTPAKAMGSETFSVALRYGSRLREVCCQMKPTTLRR
jgi:hypothetical protein